MYTVRADSDQAWGKLIGSAERKSLYLLQHERENPQQAALICMMFILAYDGLSGLGCGPVTQVRHMFIGCVGCSCCCFYGWHII